MVKTRTDRATGARHPARLHERPRLQRQFRGKLLERRLKRAGRELRQRLESRSQALQQSLGRRSQGLGSCRLIDIQGVIREEEEIHPDRQLAEELSLCLNKTQRGGYVCRIERGGVDPTPVQCRNPKLDETVPIHSAR